MRPSERKHLAELLDRAARGRTSRSDVVAMFMYVRDQAPIGSMLREIGHTIAHPHRDRGFVFTHANDTARAMIDSAAGRGDIPVPIVFEIHALLDELIEFAASNDIPHDPARLHVHYWRMGAHLGRILDGTTIKSQVEDVSLSFVWMIGDDGLPEPKVNIHFPKGLVTPHSPRGVTPVDLTIACPLLYQLSADGTAH